jgi:hypothetical protein
MLVYHNAHIGNVVRCSYVLTPLCERLLDVCVSYHLQWEGCEMFVCHNAHIGRLLDVRWFMFGYLISFVGKVDGCSYILKTASMKLLGVRTSQHPHFIVSLPI